MERGGDIEQFGNVQESERYVIHVSGTKKLHSLTIEIMYSYLHLANVISFFNISME